MIRAMSTDTLYIIIAILVFPALWLFAWFLDRIWPGMSELRKTRPPGIRMPKGPKGEKRPADAEAGTAWLLQAENFKLRHYRG